MHELHGARACIYIYIAIHRELTREDTREEQRMCIHFPLKFKTHAAGSGGAALHLHTYTLAAPIFELRHLYMRFRVLRERYYTLSHSLTRPLHVFCRRRREIDVRARANIFKLLWGFAEADTRTRSGIDRSDG